MSPFLPSFSYFLYTGRLDLELLTRISVWHFTLCMDADVVYVVGTVALYILGCELKRQVSK